MAYQEFAYFYDEFNGAADYDALFAYVTGELKAHGIQDGIVADFGCGTGELTLMLAQVCGYRPGDFVHTLGDAHLYSNHLEQVREQLVREPRALPTMRLNPEVKDIFAFRFEDFTLEGYDPQPHIAAPVAV